LWLLIFCEQNEEIEARRGRWPLDFHEPQGLSTSHSGLNPVPRPLDVRQRLFAPTSCNIVDAAVSEPDTLWNLAQLLAPTAYVETPWDLAQR